EIPTGSRNGPGAPHAPSASPIANGVPCAMLVMVYFSISSSPASLIQTSRGKPSIRAFTEGDKGRPWTSVHCFWISNAFDGITVLSTFPCHIEMRGHGPRGDEALRTRSPHSRAGREGL